MRIKLYKYQGGKKIISRWKENHTRVERNFYSHRGSYSIIIIKGAWGTLENLIKRLYGLIPCDIFILFLPEAEFMFILRKLSNEEKEAKVVKMLEYCNSFIYHMTMTN